MLLQAEESGYVEELANIEETPEQVRERMRERVRILNAEKETERKVYVDK